MGLSGVIFPDAPEQPTPIPQHSENLLVHGEYNYNAFGDTHPDTWSREGYLCTFYYTTLLNGAVNRNLRNVVTLQDITPSRTGVEFVKKIIHAMEQKIALSLRAGEVVHMTWTDSQGTTHTKKTVASFRWDGDDLILDNTEVFISGIMWKYFGWVFELAMNMRWLETVPGLPPSVPTRYAKGPNMQMVAVDPKGPWPAYMQERFRETSAFPGHADSFEDGRLPVTIIREGSGWTSVNQRALFMIMAKAFNWRFVRLNEAFERFKHSPVALQSVERPLCIMVDLIETGWLNNVYDEILRTVPYKGGNIWWEPQYVQYHSYRGHVIETVRIRVNEMDETKMVFSSGVTRMCLHFRKRASRYKKNGSHPVAQDGPS